MKSPVNDVSAALGVAQELVREPNAGELVVEASPAALPGLADRVAGGLGGRLVSLFASDERARTSRFLVHLVWSLPAARARRHSRLRFHLSRRSIRRRTGSNGR